MGNELDWRTALTASKRYDNIQRVQQALARLQSSQSAFALENEAYLSSESREQYEASCSSSLAPDQIDTQDDNHTHQYASEPFIHPDPDRSHMENPDLGVNIGRYVSCRYIASGVTAEVYRSGDRALKVIVETRNLEPHNPHREAKILEILKGKDTIIPLLETFRDQDQRFVLVFPFMPLTLSDLIARGSPLPKARVRGIFRDLFAALAYIHGRGIIHRDVKPSALLLTSSSNGTARLSDFGTTWHPALSATTEPHDRKILDVGTGPYRAPDTLFGDTTYGTAIDCWAAGCMLAECCRTVPEALFESRAAHEDGNQLGLILSIFKTIGSPTTETWPEAVHFRTPPFEMYNTFEPTKWQDILPNVPESWRYLIASLVRYGGRRVSAEQVNTFNCKFIAFANP